MIFNSIKYLPEIFPISNGSLSSSYYYHHRHHSHHYHNLSNRLFLLSSVRYHINITHNMKKLFYLTQHTIKKKRDKIKLEVKIDNIQFLLYLMSIYLYIYLISHDLWLDMIFIQKDVCFLFHALTRQEVCF